MINTEHNIGKQYIEELLKKDESQMSPNQRELYYFCSQPNDYEPVLTNMDELYKVVENALRTDKEVLLSPIPNIPHAENEIVFVRGIRRDFPDYDLAEFYESRELYEKALTHYEIAIKKDEDPTGVAYRDAGYLCLHELKDYDRAMYFFTNLGRETVEGNEYVAELYMEYERYEEALEIYRIFFPLFIWGILQSLYNSNLDDYGKLIDADRVAVQDRCNNIEQCYAKLNRTPDVWYRACCNYYDLLCDKEYYCKRSNVGYITFNK